MLNVLATIAIHTADIPGPQIDFNGPGTNGLLIVLGWIFGILLIVCLAGGGVSAALIGIGRDMRHTVIWACALFLSLPMMIAVYRKAEALGIIEEAITGAGLRFGSDVVLALDVAATEFYSAGTGYAFEGASRSAQEMAEFYSKLVDDFPLVSIEDPLSEDDWEGWVALTEAIGDKVQIVGDDLFVTNPERLERGIVEGAANALLVKVNQIGTLTETLDAVALAHNNGYKTMMSHRSGETEDTTIADLAVACSCGQIKTGAPARSERVAKYNQLLRIEEGLGDAARYAGDLAFPWFSPSA